jgi:hypothetical protein
VNIWILALLILVGGDVDTTQVDADAALIQRSDRILRELEGLPVGMEVEHEPNPAKAQAVEQGEFRYRWMYASTVRPVDDAVTIEEFGCFSWDGDRWVFSAVTGEPFSATDFAAWYSCADAKVARGSSCTDGSNWNAAGCLAPGRVMWYYIGTNERGERVKGQAVVESLAELVEEPEPADASSGE